MPDARLLPLPTFFERDTMPRLGEVWPTPKEQRAQDAVDWAKTNNVEHHLNDKVKIGVLWVDFQITFCIPGYELVVPGALGDVERTCRWSYANLDHISRFFITLDSHYPMQIFHPIYWVDRNGNFPGPFTVIKNEDIKNRIWMPNPDIAHYVFPTDDGKGNYAMMVKHSLFYTKELEDTGKYLHTVWTYHGGIGEPSHALIPALYELAFFHTVARKSQFDFSIKGTWPNTEHFSPLGPEVTETFGGYKVGEDDDTFINQLLAVDYLIIKGEAKTHCVKCCIDHLLERIMGLDPSLAQKVLIVRDGTSPVPDIPPNPSVGFEGVPFDAISEVSYKKFADAGMKFVKMFDGDRIVPIEEWGIRL